jgi:hypothetical protein
MANEYNRNIRDASALCTISKALPAATETNYSDAFDLGASGHRIASIDFQIDIPAIAAHVTVNNTTISVEDSADNSSFAAVDPAISTLIPGVASTGSVAKDVRFRMPPNVRQYVRFKQVAGATDTLTASSITYRILT